MNKMVLIGALCLGLAGNLQKMPRIKFPLSTQSVFDVERQTAALDANRRGARVDEDERGRTTEPVDEWQGQHVDASRRK